MKKTIIEEYNSNGKLIKKTIIEEDSVNHNGMYNPYNPVVPNLNGTILPVRHTNFTCTASDTTKDAIKGE